MPFRISIHRQIAGGQAFHRDHHVGDHAVVGADGQRSGAAEAGGDLVGDEQEPVLVAQLAQHGEAARVVDAHAPRPLEHGFEDHAGDLVREADAAGTVDTAGHDRLDQRPKILVLDRPLVLLEPRPVEAVSHSLILKIALATLVADRAIQRVIDQQKFHDALTGLMDQIGVGLDDHAFAAGHSAGCDRLGSLLHLDQAHAAVGRNRQPFVVTEARDFDADLFAGL